MIKEGRSEPSHQIAVIASADNYYVRKVVKSLCSMGWPPSIVLVGSRTERYLFRFNSLMRIKRQLGWAEVYKRLWRVWSSPKPISRHAVDELSDLSKIFNFKVEPYSLNNSGSVLMSIMKLNNPICVLAGCGIVNRSVIRLAGGGCLNGHPALLPGLRGVDVIPWALVEGRTVGVTAHKVVESVDAGNIIATQTVPIRFDEDFSTYRQRVEGVQAEVLASAVVGIAEGTAVECAHDLSRSVLKFAAPHRVWREAKMRLGENE